MIFTKLDTQYFNLFGDLDPFSMLDNLPARGRFAMGLWGKHEGYDYPVGIAICEETSDSLLIHWMMVDSEIRGQGLGSYMIKKLIQLAEKFNKTKLQAVFPYSPARDIICRGEKVYFKQYGFKSEEQIDGVTYLTYNPNLHYRLESMINDLSDLEESHIEEFNEAEYEHFSLGELGETKIMISATGSDNQTIVALSDMDIRETVKIINKSFESKLNGIVIINQNEFDVSTIDLDASCAIKRDDHMEALLLISLVADNLLVARKFIVSNNISRLSIALMLKYSYKKMIDKYSDKCKIFIQKEGENSEILIKALQDRTLED